MLDWFSRKRMRHERDYTSAAPPQIGQTIPDFALKRPDGGLTFLSTVSGPMALLILRSSPDMSQTHLLQTFAEKCREVRPKITRAVVVTCPEDLSTVVALAGDAQILSDETGESMLQLAPDTSMLYLVDADRQVTSTACIEEESPLLMSALWFASETARLRPTS